MRLFPGFVSVVLVVAAGLAAVSGQAPEFDLVIRGGRLVDGTGNPGFDADLGIKDGRITVVGRVSGTAARTIDASGLVVAPGFIDIHNHSDTTLLDDPDAQSMIRQGVTSMILGEGGSAAPSAMASSINRRIFASSVASGGPALGPRTSVQIWLEPTYDPTFTLSPRRCNSSK